MGRGSFEWDTGSLGMESRVKSLLGTGSLGVESLYRVIRGGIPVQGQTLW